MDFEGMRVYVFQVSLLAYAGRCHGIPRIRALEKNHVNIQEAVALLYFELHEQSMRPRGFPSHTMKAGSLRRFTIRKKEKPGGNFYITVSC
jgi:hypothetical protein